MNHRSSVVTNHKRRQNRGGDVNSGTVHRLPAYWVDGVRHRGGTSPIWGLLRNCGNLSFRCEWRSPSGEPARARVQMRSTGADQLVVAMQHCNECWAKGLSYSVDDVCQPVKGRSK